jgi:hypothetical protein
MREYPWMAIVPGEAVAPISRDVADVEALRYAVALGRDEIAADLRRCAHQIGRGGEGKTSGRKSFALWAQCLRDPDGWGAHFYHANVIGNLQTNRKAAVLYLREMAERRGGALAEPLRRAAALYEEVVQLLDKTNVNKDVMEKPEGREQLVGLADEMARLEAQAVSELQNAVTLMT